MAVDDFDEFMRVAGAVHDLGAKGGDFLGGHSIEHSREAFEDRFHGIDRPRVARPGTLALNRLGAISGVGIVSGKRNVHATRIRAEIALLQPVRLRSDVGDFCNAKFGEGSFQSRVQWPPVLQGSFLGQG